MENNYYQQGGWKKWIWIYLVIAVVVYGGIYLYLKNKNGGSLYGGNSSPAAFASLTTANPIVNSETNSSVGSYLADGTGKTLYTYSGDSKDVSNCTGSCLANWPAYVASGTASVLPSSVTIITRSDGTKQYAYNDMPLYYFSGDSSAGQVTGDGVSGFHVAKP